MWKWFLLLWIVQWRTLLSQPVISENIRESRHLNFDECCPCHNSGRSSNDHGMFDTTMEQAATVNNCPCMSEPDSEPASSIFSPALRAVEPFTRSAKERNPKPLLDPEVGLASSVLETLREVTDQEYQEALARDAARNALRDTEYSFLEQEAIDTPRNIVNIILQPKEGLTDDAVPEASHVQETRCIHPSDRSNSFKQKKYKLSNKPLSEYFPLSAPTRGNKYFDMENSPSNMQEQVIPPSKTNFLQDLKSKSDLLKMKLLSSSKNGLKGYTDLNTPNLFSRQGDCDNFYNNRASRVPNFKLGSIVDLLKASKHKSPPSPPNIDKQTEKDQGNDFTFSPNNLEKYYIRNNGRGYYAPNNRKLSLLNTEQGQKSKQMAHPNDISVKDNFFETENYSTLAQSETKLIPYTETNLKNDNKILTNDDEDNNYLNIFNNKRLKNTINSNSYENTDAVPSASEFNIVEKSMGEINAKENSLKKECEINSDPITTADIDETSDDQKQTFIEETIPINIFDESINQENNEVFTKSVEVVDLKDNSGEESLCDVNDLKTGSSNIVSETNIPQENNKKFSFDIDHESSVNAESSSSTTTNKVIVNDGPYNINKMNTLPNIRADILKTLQNVKKVNEKIHEKLKSNVKNGLKVEKIDGSIESTTLSTPTSNINEDNNEMKHDISTQDLQEMSNRILNLSLSNERVVDPLVLESKSIKSYKTNTAEKTDRYITTSEVNNIEISTVSTLPMIEPTSTLSYSSSKNVDEIVDTVDKMADKKQDNENNEILDSISGKNLCENIAPKNLAQTELSSSNDREKEMMSEASSPVINSIPHTSGNIIVQPNPNRNVEEFLNNFKSSISDIVNNRDMNAQNDNGYDNSNTNSIYLKNNQKYNFNEQPFSDSIKSFSRGLKDNNLFKSNKNNNLNSYKAKVAIPESLDIKATPSLINKKEERLQKSFKDNPEITSASNILRSSLEKPNFSRLTNYMDNALNNYDPRLNLQIPRINTFSENLRSRTEETLRNIQESFDDLQKPQVRNQNIRVGENPKKSNIFRSLQANDISKRLQDFNSDIIDKLSLMSQRIQGDSQSKNNKNSLNKRLKSNQKLKPQVKDNVLLKSKQTSNLKPTFINSNKKSDISMPYLTQKSGIPISGNLKNAEHSKLRSGYETKPQLGKDIKRKSIKENKVTFSFTTTIRPETLKLRSNSKILEKATSAPIRSSSDLPKFSTQSKSPLQKRLELMSKLKAVEPKPLASNRFTSRIALPDRKLDNSITTPSSSLEDFSVPLVDDETANLKRVLAMDNDAVSYSPDNMVLTKIRDAVKAKSNGNMNKNFLDNRINNLKSSAMADATHSASHNINTAVSNLTDKPLKENVSYKCKMVCYEDKDSK